MGILLYIYISPKTIFYILEGDYMLPKCRHYPEQGPFLCDVRIVQRMLGTLAALLHDSHIGVLSGGVHKVG